MIKTKKQMFTIIGAFLLVMLLTTVTYAFFNYTRTGTANNIRTGKIYFNAEQGDTVTLSDLFPIKLEASQEVTSETPGVGSLVLHVTGDTTYEDGIEYLVKAVDVTNTSGNASLPISIAISYEANGQGKTIGEEDEDYFENRGGDTSVYKVLSTDSITDDGDLVVGYIAPGATGVDGNITIMAYLDARNIAITDTYPEGDVTHTEASGETSVEVVDYTDGTTSEWVNGRSVFTTEEWNALQASGVSFKIKVEANEGVWVDEPIEPICKRVTNVANLHTETCSQSNTSLFCHAVGYELDGIITYGNAKALGSGLAVGDAFDCKVSTTGDYTERFYYISDYYDTSTKTFDTSTATLIYYQNFVNGSPSNGKAKYDLGYDNWYGPREALNHLPSTSTWNNIELKSSSRNILACDNFDCSNTPVATTTNGYNTINNPFIYSGKSARLLTLMELGETDCASLSNTQSLSSGGSLSACDFLLEGTKYADPNNPADGLFLETPVASNSGPIYILSSTGINVYNKDVSDSNTAIRPAIDVPYSRIEY